MAQELGTSMEKAPQRALLKALGLDDDDISKPLVAVVSADSEIGSGHIRLDRITDAVKAGVYANGCTPIVVPAISVAKGLSMSRNGTKYALPSRELVADCVETALVAHPFDGAVFVANSEETIAGMLMGAARMNIPSVFVSGGAMHSGDFHGKRVGLDDVYKGVEAVKCGDMSRDELDGLENAACPDIGSTSGLFSAEILSCVCEALGLALPGNGSVLATSSDRIRLAKHTGEAICRLVREAIAPRMILTKRAFTNAVTLCMALGGSTSAILHIIAIAAECGIVLDLDFINNISAATPTLCAPCSQEFDVERFHAAGGVSAVLHELAKKNLIDGSAFTASGGRLADVYEHAHVKDENTIRKIDDPISPVGGVTVVKGTLAEGGALVKRSVAGVSTFTGKAKCFNCEEDAVAAISSGKIKSGDAVVVRYEGPIGGPGMREMLAISSAIVAAKLENDVVLVTDGRLSDAIACTAVGHVCPEAAEGGKIALVQDNDVIKLDIQGGKINLDVPAKTLDARRKKLRPHDSAASGFLLRYQNLVTSAAGGAILKKKF